jgi:flagellar biosynthesis/type III secretory pathway protein FliH
MSPGILHTEPETTNQFKQGYKEGFEAGKASLKKELRLLVKELDKLESERFSTSTGTYNSINN